MLVHPTKLTADDRSTFAKRLANTFAYLSLLCSISFLVEGALSRVHGVPGQNLTGFQWFKIMAVAVVLAVTSFALGSKLWKLALAAALAIFLLVMYVMGT
jgi:hypothetical protein